MRRITPLLAADVKALDGVALDHLLHCLQALRVVSLAALHIVAFCHVLPLLHLVLLYLIDQLL